MLHYYDKDRMVRKLAAKLGKSTQEIIEIAVTRLYEAHGGNLPEPPRREAESERDETQAEPLVKPRSLDDVMRGTE